MNPSLSVPAAAPTRAIVVQRFAEAAREVGRSVGSTGGRAGVRAAALDPGLAARAAYPKPGSASRNDQDGIARA